MVEKNSEINLNSYHNSELRRAENDKSMEMPNASSLVEQKNTGVIYDLFDSKAKKRQSKQAATIN